MPSLADNITLGEKLRAISRVARWRPKITIGLVFFGGSVAIFEGIGLTFIFPIIELAQGASLAGRDPIMDAFLAVYEFIGLPFTLGYLIIGIALVMTLRFTASFLVAWLNAFLQHKYEMTMRSRAFDATLDSSIEYFDREGSDDILNAIITETRYAGLVIRFGVRSMEAVFLAIMYLAVMLYIAPVMTFFALALLGGITIFLRRLIEPAFTVGTRVAQANENVQRAVQAGTQGIRDVKLFGLSPEVYDQFSESLRQYTSSSVELARNDAAIKNFYNLSAAITLFVLIYFGFVFTGLSIGALGIFLFAMFQLAPLASKLNRDIYKMEGNLSHLVRTQAFLDELEHQTEDHGERTISELTEITFDNVSFSYDNSEQVLDGISFEAKKGDFIAFVGQSGAGKSTIVSLLARMYEPDHGEIYGNSVPIAEYDLDEWRSGIAVVRQQPFIFNDTLENNVTIGNRDATRTEVERVCRIARVNEFLPDLPNGYDSKLGDDGVRLSGGQRQRVALARALLKDADFLVLDEATSDLDSHLEREVQQAIETMDRDYGIIAIAHRLSTVENARCIYTMEHGKLIESGRHHELVEKGGKYAELYAIQSAT